MKPIIGKILLAPLYLFGMITWYFFICFGVLVYAWIILRDKGDWIGKDEIQP